MGRHATDFYSHTCVHATLWLYRTRAMDGKNGGGEKTARVRLVGVSDMYISFTAGLARQSMGRGVQTAEGASTF